MTGKITILAAILFVGSLLVALGNADDQEASSTTAPHPPALTAPDAFKVADRVGTGVYEPVANGSDPEVRPTVSVLTLPRTSEIGIRESEGNSEPSTGVPIVSEPLEFSPPGLAQPTLGSADDQPEAADAFPLISGAAALPDREEPAPIVSPGQRDVEFELYSEQIGQRTNPPVASQDRRDDSYSSQADDEWITQRGAIPQIQIITRVPSVLRTEHSSVFEIVAINEGGDQVEDVFLVTDLPKWIELTENNTTHGSVEATANGSGTELQWQVGKLAAGARAIWRLKITAHENRAFQLSTRWTVQPLGIATDIQVIEPELQLSLDGPQEMIFGETQVFSVRVTNTGNGNAEEVVLRVSPGLEAGQSIGQLNAGASKLIELELTAEQAGVMKMSASVSADGSDMAEKEIEITIRRPELSIEVFGPAQKFAGTSVKYRIEVTNQGDVAAQEVMIEAVLPKNAQYLKDGKQIPNSRRNMSWDIGKVDIGTTRTFEFECILIDEGDNPLAVRVTAAAAESRTAATMTRVRGVADLKLLVNDPSGPVTLGESAVYEIHVFNRGTRAAHGVDVLAQFGYGVEPQKVEGHTAELIPGQVIFDTIDTIAPGEKVVLKVLARADTEGRHKFRVKLTGKDPDTTLTQEEMTWYLESVSTDDGPVILQANGADR